jgi:hypothetical protein
LRYGASNRQAANLLVILIAVPLLALAAVDFVSRRDSTRPFTALLALVAFAGFVLDLTLLGERFNLIASPYAFLAWGAFGLILAYFYAGILPLAAGLICILIFCAGTLTSISGMWWTGFWGRSESILASGALIALVPALTPRMPQVFAGVYRLVGLLAVFVAILHLWINGGASGLLVDPKLAERIYGLLALPVAGTAVWLGVRFRLRGTANLAAAFFAVSAYLAIFKDLPDWIPPYVFFLAAGGAAIVLRTLYRQLRERMA